MPEILRLTLWKVIPVDDAEHVIVYFLGILPSSVDCIKPILDVVTPYVQSILLFQAIPSYNGRMPLVPSVTMTNNGLNPKVKVTDDAPSPLYVPYFIWHPPDESCVWFALANSPKLPSQALVAPVKSFPDFRKDEKRGYPLFSF